MELSFLCSKLKEIFELEDLNCLSEKLLKISLKNENGYITKYQDFQSDLSEDWMQIFFQYYMAERKEKKQDYTPKSLAKLACLLSKTEDEKSVIDLCAGSGALTIQKWVENPNINFICYEFDEQVIPFLVFNLLIRNCNATVIHGDALSDEVFKVYKLKKGDKFSSVNICDKFKIKADNCVSNPPFNLKWSHPPFAQMQKRFLHYTIPPESNANFAFVLTALEIIESKASFILPTGVLSPSTSDEKEVLKELCEKNYIESVIIMPDKMFEKTSISTAVLTFNKNKKSCDVSFVDMRQTFSEEKREQKGQFGGNSHENRTYTKTVKLLNENEIQKCLSAIENKEDIPEFSKTANINEIAKNDYVLVPSRYIQFKTDEIVHREFKDITADLNRIIEEKNTCKLTMNENIAKSLGLYDVYELSKKREFDKDTESLYESIGIKILKDDFISLSKNKNEIKFENKSKDKLSTIFLSILQMWKQHIMYLGTEENRLSCELRDALLNDLMSGKIEL